MKPESSRIAIARITGHPDRQGYFPVTVGGDGLSSLKTPCQAELYKPEYQGVDLNKILEVSRTGPSESGQYYPVQIISKKVAGLKGKIQLSGELPENMEGYWVCLPKSVLKSNDDEFYVFEILGLAVYKDPDEAPIGQITDYMETGAHGIIEVQLDKSTAHETILIPMISKYVTFLANHKGVVIEDIYDFQSD